MRPCVNLLLLAAIIVATTATTGCKSASAKYFLKTKSSANVFVERRPPKIEKVAVMPFTAQTELTGSLISDLIVTELMRTGKYKVLERSQINNVLRETELAMSGISSAQAVAVGKMLGADGVIIGTVSEYSTVARWGRTYPVVGFSVRLIDTSSSQIIWSADIVNQSRDRRLSLPEHARDVVHEGVAGLYQQWHRYRMVR